MDLTRQIIMGTSLLSLCAVLHVFLLSKGIEKIPHLSKKIEHMSFSWRLPISVGLTFAMVVVSHTLQVWIWAISFVFVGAIPDWATSVYFGLVTYSSLGYGDITLGPDHRVFAAFASITGMLAFGVSTAFLVGLVTRILSESPNLPSNRSKDEQP